MVRRKVVKHSKGEKLCGRILKEIFGKINVKSQFTLLSPLKTYYIYDFMFIHNNVEYLLEYDGIQHFEYTQIIHRKPENFEKRFQRDIDKSALALVCGYKLVRIDYNIINEIDIKNHILNSIKSSDTIYVSDESKYQKFMECNVNTKICQLYS
jgi:very-short-patch-repair endonuclease